MSLTILWVVALFGLFVSLVYITSVNIRVTMVKNQIREDIGIRNRYVHEDITKLYENVDELQNSLDYIHKLDTDLSDVERKLEAIKDVLLD